jgi:hypothetical protein
MEAPLVLEGRLDHLQHALRLDAGFDRPDHESSASI